MQFRNTAYYTVNSSFMHVIRLFVHAGTMTFIVACMQDAVDALAAYQQRVQAHEQQLQSQLRELRQHNATLSARLQQLQLEHSPCAAFR